MPNKANTFDFEETSFYIVRKKYPEIIILVLCEMCS